MLLDDQSGWTDPVRLFFEREGYEIDVCNIAEDAAQAAMDFEPDVVLLDIEWPDEPTPGDSVMKMLGDDIYNSVLEQYGDCCILFLTNKFPDQEIESWSGKWRGRWVLKKPNPPSAIVEKVYEKWKEYNVG